MEKPIRSSRRLLRPLVKNAASIRASDPDSNLNPSEIDFKKLKIKGSSEFGGLLKAPCKPDGECDPIFRIL